MQTYLALKSLHILGVVLFVGNIVVTGWWKVQADRTRQPAIVAFAQRQVTLTDWLFTFGGVLLVGIGAYANAYLHGLDLAAPWLVWGQALFIASGLLWVAILIPVQIRQARLARGFAGGGPIPDEYWRLNRVWLWVGILATVLPAANLYFMVFKPV
ncbi:MAG: hypothetical protein EFKGCFLK_01081 [Rhodocyclaceae bacterium]|nr:DUF2269 domain-containing protein [Zoogloeaceae bacterium]MBV6407514.1 hypothetical protein [Rhodocyclaceae bacterium]MCK6384422.1 DUF2269 domain-containing protein [Rhodocyclaceae bacterium]CAG0944497.1 hypothetical protein GPROT2_02661 [Gammaproteobacteria bacterium]